MEDNFTLSNQAHQVSKKSCAHNSEHMLPVFDYMSDIPGNTERCDLVEVQFKHTRKAYFHNDSHLPLEKGSLVVVAATPGYDIGEVTLLGELVPVQIKKYRLDTERHEIRSIIRIATEADLAVANEAHAKEHETMIRARELAKSLGLEMKVGDVEYQADGTKAIFYYIADGRVDFRQLIKVYAESFRVRIEMKQIGARQEAGRIGGTGPCGRELCCSTWMSQFNSVGTNAARLQNLSLNPQKLAGQCAKLKCCLNYEVPVYEEAVKKLPSRRYQLETKDAIYYLFSSDPLKGELTYSTDPHSAVNLQIVTPERAWEIIEMNQIGQKPEILGGKDSSADGVVGPDYENVVGQDDLTRFDKKKHRPNNDRRRDNRPNRRPDRPNDPQNNRHEKDTDTANPQ